VLKRTIADRLPQIEVKIPPMHATTFRKRYVAGDLTGAQRGSELNEKASQTTNGQLVPCTR
jgi:hypothetical protein